MLGNIDPTSDRPVYRQIADKLRDAIKAGQLAEGAALPSESALAEHYKVARMTARQAVEVLKQEGLVISEHGRGVFVRTRLPVFRSARNRFARDFREAGKGAYDVEMKSRGLAPRLELDLGIVEPPSVAADRLTLGPNEKVLMRRRRMYANDQPTQLATSYVPETLAKAARLDQPETGPGGLYSRLADIDHAPARFTEEVSTRIATDIEARFFRHPAPQPVLHVVRTAFDEANAGVEICEHIMTGDLWLLNYEWLAE